MKVLLIGYGSIGKRHAGILQAFPEVESITIVSQHQVDGFSVSHLEAVQKINEFDYFLISSETCKHFEQLEYLENAVRGKLILVEKPIFHEYRTLTSHRNRIFVAYNLRFHPLITKIRILLKGQNALSVNVTAGQYLPTWRPDTDYRTCYSANRNQGGGVQWDLSHEIDYIQWLFGDIVSFESVALHISDLEISSDDYVTLIGKTQKSVYVSLSLDYISKIPERRILIHTSKMTLIGDFVKNELVYRSIGDIQDTKINFSEVTRNSSYENMHRELLFSNHNNGCTFNEAITTVQLIDKISKKSENKNE